MLRELSLSLKWSLVVDCTLLRSLSLSSFVPRPPPSLLTWPIQKLPIVLWRSQTEMIRNVSSFERTSWKLENACRADRKCPWQHRGGESTQRRKELTASCQKQRTWNQYRKLVVRFVRVQWFNAGVLTTGCWESSCSCSGWGRKDLCRLCGTEAEKELMS